MQSKTLPSYCTSGRQMEGIGGIVIHYFSCQHVDPDDLFDLVKCRNLFLDLNRPKIERERYMKADNWPDKRMFASAHLMIGRGGEVWKLVEFARQAYHAGRSILDGRKNCNRWTIGIELIGTNTSGFTNEQYEQLADTLVDLQNTYNIPRDRIAGHDTVRAAAVDAGEATKKKYDPSGRWDGHGDNFDWQYLWTLVDRRTAALRAELADAGGWHDA